MFELKNSKKESIKVELILPESYSRKTVETMFGRIWMSGCLGGLAISFAIMGGWFFSILSLMTLSLSIFLICIISFMYIDHGGKESLEAAGAGPTREQES